MDNFEEMYKTICRLCLSHSKPENLFSLFDEKSADGLSCYGKSVISFSKIILKINDNLPTMMCKRCVLTLKQLIRFKFMCENSELRLKKLYEMSAEAGEDFKENVCQYTMFSLYFPDASCEKTSNNTTKEIDSKNHLSSPKNLHKKLKYTEKSGCEKIKRNIERNKCNETLHEFDVFDNNSDIIKTFKGRRRISNLQKQPTKPDLKCKICEKVLANKLSYKCHMQRHNGCQYICETCGKGFPSSRELNTHTVARHGTGDYLQCDHCDYKASQKFLLVEHIRLHTGERPFTCEKCGLTFRRRAIWKKHLVNHTEKTLQCKLCPKKFHHTSYLDSHMNSSHERKYMFSCTKCGCLYAKSRTVRKHLLEKHGIPRAQQGKIPKVVKGDTNFFGNEN